METKGCPACGSPLTLPTQYLDAVAAIRERVEEFTPAIIKDYLLNQWISVEDRLPEIGVRILAYSPGYTNEQMTHRILDAQFLRACNEVTHWMAIPDNPEAKS
uniref:DUF551 domain-containing protein n=1 Tax=viral metagenome TaxID=1070528 RepID=A0A6M3LJW3_9ZZZZ